MVFEDALEQARHLDAAFKETGQLKGPLHGIPITLKDQFNVKGVDTTLGYVGRSFAPAREDAVLVQIIKDMGAVVIAKSNLPQSIMVCLLHACEIPGINRIYPSGRKPRTPSGGLLPIPGTQNSLLGARVAAKALCWHCMARYSGWELILEGASESRRAQWVYMASNPA